MLSCRAQTCAMENALSEAGVPCQLLGGPELLKREFVADALAYLRLAVHPDDDAAFQRICNKPARGIGVVTLLLCR